jgi:ADP-ribose pyrophosphatase
VLARRELFSARPWVRLFVEQVRLPGGHVVDDFYRVELPDFAAVVAQTPDGRIVAEHQYKHGVGRTSLTLPAGLIEEGENPLSTAKRELLEETGYAAEEWRPLGSFVVDGNRGAGRAHFFLAANARPIAAPLADEAEPLALRLLTPEEMLAAIRAGEVAILGSMAAFMLALESGLLRKA